MKMDFMLNLPITEHKWTYSKAHRKLSKHTRDNLNWWAVTEHNLLPLIGIWFKMYLLKHGRDKKSPRLSMFLHDCDMVVGGPLGHVHYCPEIGRFSMKSIFKSWFLGIIWLYIIR